MKTFKLVEVEDKISFLFIDDTKLDLVVGGFSAYSRIVLGYKCFTWSWVVGIFNVPVGGL